MTQYTYTTWLGDIPDVEGVSLSKAKEIYQEWINKGYDDVFIERDQDGAIIAE